MLNALLAKSDATLWLPRSAVESGPVDHLFYGVLAVNVFFSALILVMLGIFVLKYRHRPGVTGHDSSAGHSTALELTWTIIPTLLVLVIFYYGFKGYLHAGVIPPTAYEVTVNGRTWQWSYKYPGGFASPDGILHVPVDTKIGLVLESEDVIHDFYVPEFRMKKDVVPGRYNRTWFEAKEIGTFDVYCAMYCGAQHSVMLSKVKVESREDFEKFMTIAKNPFKTHTPIEVGEMIYKTRGCANCHSVTGPIITGPTWKDMYGSQVPLADGQKVLADDAYVTESIQYPAAKIHAGFPNVMPPFNGQFSTREIGAIIWYMKSISSNFKGDLTPGKTLDGDLAPAKPAGSPAAVPAAP
ncbi:MAG: Cytochrome c oxidase polypeptide [Phycisphaerales bacterium]|nr:Cytochrome c oxidase polypeptide [Phycisphaerales bacterium]